MFIKQGGKMKDFWFRVIAGIFLLAAIVGIGFFAYNAGVTHAAVVALPEIRW